MKKKYSMILNKNIEFKGKKLFKIEAQLDFIWGGIKVKKGDEGGYIESESNLGDDCWISGGWISGGKKRNGSV